MKPKKQTPSAKPKRLTSAQSGLRFLAGTHTARKPSQLERDLRASIAIAKLQRRVSNLETAMLELQRFPEPSWDRKAREMRQSVKEREQRHLCESHNYPRS